MRKEILKTTITAMGLTLMLMVSQAYAVDATYENLTVTQNLTAGDATTSVNTIQGLQNNIAGTTLMDSSNWVYHISLTNDGIGVVDQGGAGLSVTSTTVSFGSLNEKIYAGPGYIHQRAGTPWGTGAEIKLETDNGASMTYTSQVEGENYTHGIYINGERTLITGGTTSTALTLDDSGATFQDTATAGPARVTGVADGSSRYDAVNYGQLNSIAGKMEDIKDDLSQGVAMASALAAIPQVETGKRFSLGAGTGFYHDEFALAVGGSVRLMENTVFKGGVSLADGDYVTANAGVAFSW